MKYIRTMTQQKLSFWLALYIGWFMNVAVFFRRFDGYAQEFTFWKGLSGVVELVATVFVTFFLLRLLSLFGRRIWRILATLIVLFSAAASYYMTFLNVVIGYGIIASVMTTDIDLSKEVIGWHLILWLVAVSAPPLLFIWSNRCRHTLLRQLRTPGQRVKNVLIVVLAGLIVWGPIRLLELRQHDVERHSEVDMPSYGGVIANSYLPSNWLSALGLYAWAQVDESSDNKSLINPAKKFTYVAPEGLDDTYVVFIIGETTRWDHTEQFRVPMMVWMSDKYLENPDHAAAFAHLQQQAAMKVPRRHVELYDTIMGCLGYTSPDGGINENNNWCRWKK
ncbi:phosphoethanolamine transferase domain-containing protein [Klebsiella pneumoniae]